MSDYSRRMSANNDGMDPDWKPNFTPSKSDPIEKLKSLILACSAIAEAAKDVPNERTPSGAQTISWYKVSCSSSVWNDFVAAYDEVKFK